MYLEEVRDLRYSRWDMAKCCLVDSNNISEEKAAFIIRID